MKFCTLGSPMRMAVSMYEAVKSAYITYKSCGDLNKDGDYHPVVILLTIRDQIRMPGFRVSFNGKHKVNHNKTKFTLSEEVILFEGIRAYMIGYEEVKFEKLDNTTFSIVHLFTENGID